jgi:hypothetical protein
VLVIVDWAPRRGDLLTDPIARLGNEVRQAESGGLRPLLGRSQPPKPPGQRRDGNLASRQPPGIVTGKVVDGSTNGASQYCSCSLRGQTGESEWQPQPLSYRIDSHSSTFPKREGVVRPSLDGAGVLASPRRLSPTSGGSSPPPGGSVGPAQGIGRGKPASGGANSPREVRWCAAPVHCPLPCTPEAAKAHVRPGCARSRCSEIVRRFRASAADSAQKGGRERPGRRLGVGARKPAPD